MSTRRDARRAPVAQEIDGIPADLAAGPCVEIWADSGCHFPQWSARNNWHSARNEWARKQGLDYRHLPRHLMDQAPYYRDRKAN
jgi:hypothetical protein